MPKTKPRAPHQQRRREEREIDRAAKELLTIKKKPIPPIPTGSDRQCCHCGTNDTPQWRRYPELRGTIWYHRLLLCNADGLKIAKGPRRDSVALTARAARAILDELARLEEEGHDSDIDFPARIGNGF